MKSPVPQKKKRWMSAQVRVLPTKKCPRWDSLFSSCPCTARCHASRVTCHALQPLILTSTVGKVWVVSFTSSSLLLAAFQALYCTRRLLEHLNVQSVLYLLLTVASTASWITSTISSTWAISRLLRPAMPISLARNLEMVGVSTNYILIPDAGGVNLQMVMDWQIFSPL